MYHDTWFHSSHILNVGMLFRCTEHQVFSGKPQKIESGIYYAELTTMPKKLVTLHKAVSNQHVNVFSRWLSWSVVGKKLDKQTHPASILFSGLKKISRVKRYRTDTSEIVYGCGLYISNYIRQELEIRCFIIVGLQKIHSSRKDSSFLGRKTHWLV